MQWDYIAVDRAQGKDTTCHLSPVLEVPCSSAPAAHTASGLAPQEQQEQQELQTSFPSARISTRWSRAHAGPEGLSAEANTGEGMQSSAPAAVSSSSLNYVAKSHSFSFLLSNK